VIGKIVKGSCMMPEGRRKVLSPCLGHGGHENRDTVWFYWSVFAKAAL
jgi:hypothetical protein